MLILTDDYAEHDLIGHAPYRDGLVEVIRSVESKGSFTIGIYGQWGSGKTSILKQIKTAFDNPETAGDKPVLTVWFNPWQFVADEHLIIPFFHTLYASLEKIAEQTTIEKIKAKIPGFLEKIAHVPLALFYGMEAEFKIPLLLKTKFDVSKAIDYQQKAAAEIDKKVAQKHKTAMSAAAKEYESTYYTLIQALQDAAVDLDLKIVVFIDDLDRCLPDKAVQLLEGLKVLLDLPNFVFVMGVARDVIERGVRIRHKDLYKDDSKGDLPNIEGQYLDKIIQFPFSLPSANPDELKLNILSQELKKLKGAEKYVDLIHEVLGNNPRTLKRFVNAISFTLHLAEKKAEKNDGFRTELMIKISLIGYLFPSLYRQVEKHPGLLVRLENIVREINKETLNKKEDSGEVLMEPYSQIVKKTDLRIVDQWLEEGKIDKLVPILTIRENLPGDSDVEEIGFSNRERVIKYVRLLATTLQPEVTSKDKVAPTQDKPLSKEMKDRMVLIPKGNFLMGDEHTGRVEVTITRPFFMDKYPVTQALYQKVMDKNPSHFKGEDLPVENVSWFDAVEFCNELSRMSGLLEVYVIDGKKVTIDYEKNGYRLPTEAEWEYACRGKTTGDPSAELDDIAWYNKNSGKHTQGVGQKEANGFGLYDMLGNVREWCNDWYTRKYPVEPQEDPIGAENGIERLLRGESWDSIAGNLRETYRNRKEPSTRDNDQGFRLVLPSI